MHIKLKRIICFFVIALIGATLLPINSPQVQAATNTDLLDLSRVEAFKKACAVGDNERKLSQDDFSALFDSDLGEVGGNGDQGITLDNGESAAVGYLLENNNGVMTCETLLPSVMRIIVAKLKLPVTRDYSNFEGARDLLLHLMLEWQGTPKDGVILFNSSSNHNPFNYTPYTNSEHEILLEDKNNGLFEWNYFVNHYILETTKSIGGNPSAAQIADRLKPALNVCFTWSDKPFKGGSDVSLKYPDSSPKIYGERRDNSYIRDNIPKVLPGFNDRSGFTESGGNQLGDITLEPGWAWDTLGKDDYSFDKSDWYPYGSDLYRISNSTVGDTTVGSIISCGDLVRLWDTYKTALVYSNGEVGSTKPSEELADAEEATATPPPTDDIDLNCDVKITNPLTWLFCPVVEAATELINVLDAQIVKELNVNTGQYFGTLDNQTTTQKSFYNTWVNFRNIALIILVLAGLVMVIGQAISVGPFDPYTVKKVIPRMIFAIIFISVSWEACQFLVEVTNDLALAVRFIIQSPFRDIGNATVGGKVTSGLASAGILGAGVIGLGLVGLLSLAVTAALAVIIAFFVLTIRKMVIIFLVLMAPFAIACYILPNTQKVWKFWWDTFSKALLMFPIIMGFIAIGRVFAAVAAKTDPDHSDLLTQVIVVIAYFGPYFALPTAFRLAGGAVANIAGIANDRSRGIFDRLKKGRQERMSDRFTRAGQGRLWNAQKGPKFIPSRKIDPKTGKRVYRTLGSLTNDAASMAVRPDQYFAYANRNNMLGKLTGTSGMGNRLAASIEHR